MSWHTVLQDASFKGAHFEVEAIDEENGKALAAHERPFVQGVDLEDMGNMGRQVQISAVFWGKGYAGRLKTLLEALETPGAGVLVHPVWGRMTNMMAASWRYRHEADNVDYAALDMTFREATESQPIFVFENAFLMRLEQLIQLIDTYREAAFGLIDALLAVDGGVSDLWGSALGIWGAGYGVFRAVAELFALDIAWPGGGAYASAGFAADMAAAQRVLADAVQAGLRAEAGLAVAASADAAAGRADGLAVQAGGLGARARFDAAALKVDELLALPRDLLSGKGETAGWQGRRLQKITAANMQPVAQALRLLALAALAEVAAELVEAEGEVMSAPDLMHINRVMRRRVQAEIDLLREVQAQARQGGSGAAGAVYSSSHAVAEALRDTAQHTNALIVAAINQKPPLIVRPAPLTGTMHQIAHAFYGDWRRADELIRLNPHIVHPAFVALGEWVNGYAK